MSEMENIERLISRKLDGELTADEQLVLDRALVRNPEYRDLFADYERIDAECGDVLGSILVTSKRSNHRHPIRVAASGATNGGTVGGKMPRLWWVLPVAAAACIAVFGMIGLHSSDSDNPIEEPSIVKSSLADDPATPGYSPIRRRQKPDLTSRPEYVEHIRPRNNERRSPIDYGIIPVSTQAPRLERHRDTGIIGIPGEDGKIYLIEVQRTRTYGQSQPHGRRMIRNRGL